VIPQLRPSNKDFIILKRRYSAFFQTDLKILLDELKVDTLIITGLHTHMCCRHTAADGYQYGYNIVIPKDATNSFTQNDYEYGLEYAKATYGATITNVDDLIKKF
jgi:nicotinamidase-related amidase